VQLTEVAAEVLRSDSLLPGSNKSPAKKRGQQPKPDSEQKVSERIGDLLLHSNNKSSPKKRGAPPKTDSEQKVAERIGSSPNFPGYKSCHPPEQQQ
jgi:hypothetical protein